jgi:glutamyl-Q tRNA(Asp) synthetase
LPEPAYRHHRLIRDETGHKLSKSSGSTGLRELRGSGAAAAEIRRHLGI